MSLTYRYLGWRTLLFRIVTFPLRLTPLKRRLRLRSDWGDDAFRRAVAWYREHGRPVDVVIASFRDAERVEALVASIRRTVAEGMVRVIVADDASGGEHLAQLARIEGIDVVAGERNEGFAANVNRGVRVTDPARDVVLLNSDVEARAGWLVGLQYAASQEDDVGIVGPKLLYPETGELATLRSAGLFHGAEPVAVAAIGVAEIAFGLLCLLLPRRRALFLWNAAALLLLLAAGLFANPSLAAKKRTGSLTGGGTCLL